MKIFSSNITTLILSLVTPLLACCEPINESQNDSDCIDESLIDSTVVCYMIYDPVCGCNQVTYSNDCVAENNGVLFFEKGSCN